ncbi:MAG: hypothetical protein EPN82_07105 [Bacteroidetes bacterium]|nr:MAG: hypothetical protein EPN82_07105 [Bacteroidota bacterium]
MPKLKDEIKRLNQSKKGKIHLNNLPEGFSLYVEYNIDKERQRTFLNLKVSGKEFITKEDKRVLYEAELKRDMLEQEYLGDKNNFKLNKKITDADFLDYFKNISNKNKLPSYNGALRKLEEFVKIQTKSSYLNFSSINTKFCMKFREYLLDLVGKNKLVNQTAKTYMTVFAATLNRAVSDNIIPTNPASKIRIKGIESKREFLNEDELKKFIMVDTKYSDIKNAFIFSSQTSLRLGDIRALEFKNVNFNKENDAYLYFRQQKTKGVSNIKLSRLAIDIYNKQKEKHPSDIFVFNLPKSKSFINDKLREIAIEAGIQKYIHFHVSRHTWATLALSRGVDIYTVSKIMGHSSVAITEIYANLISKKKDEVADIINIEITEEDLKKKELEKKKKSKPSIQT